MASTVVFSLRAQIRLRQRLARALAEDPRAMTRSLNDIETRMGQVFPGQGSVIVQDLYSGFRDRTGERILLVELTKSDDLDGTYVVKLGPEDKLDQEYAGWTDCRPAGLRHDIVLMSVEARKVRGRTVALLYSDAQHFIGVDETMPLDAAWLDATLHGVPTPESASDALLQLYERLGLLLYRSSYVENPQAKGYRFQLERFDAKLPSHLELWNARSGAAFECRAAASTFTEVEPLRDWFSDPVSFFAYLRSTVQNDRQAGLQLIPTMLRGNAHGDLHGRNVLVGRVGDRVLWPAVYDYGDMGRDNLIGWDFVKMETELKIRAWPRVFQAGMTIPNFIPAVVKFEQELADATEQCRNTDGWPVAPAPADPAGRLRWQLLKLRQLADAHLGRRRNRSREWLAEYYFLLTVYGLNSVRFSNLSHLELLGAYLSSGTACARYLYDRETTESER